MNPDVDSVLKVPLALSASFDGIPETNEEKLCVWTVLMSVVILSKGAKLAGRVGPS